MTTATTALRPAPTTGQRIGDVLMRGRDWLDSRGRMAWIVAMVLGFIAFWPVGLALLTYMIWSKRMTGNSTCRGAVRYDAPSSGNSAFDAYRAETLKRLEDEHREFMDFLAKLREAKDKAEFDQFMEKRDAKTEA